jgi:hypothetical protein
MGRCLCHNRGSSSPHLQVSARPRCRAHVNKGTALIDKHQSPVDVLILLAEQPFVDPRFEESQFSPSSDPCGS